MASICLSPSITIEERFDIRGGLPQGETAFLTGFTQYGPTDLPYLVTSVQDFEVLFGKPDANAPEQNYAYTAARDIIESAASLIFTRLPYGANEGELVGDEYSALVYTAYECDTDNQGGGSSTLVGYEANTFQPASAFEAVSGLEPFNDNINDGEFITLDDYAVVPAPLQGSFDPVLKNNCDAIIINEPIQIKLSQDEYDLIQCGDFNWSDDFTCDAEVFSAYDPETFGQAAMVVIDKTRSKTSNLFEGFYVTVNDNFDADPASIWNSVNDIKYNNGTAGNGWKQVPDTRYDFALSAEAVGNNGSVSQTVEFLAGQDVDLPWEDDTHKDHLNLTLWRLKPDDGDVTKLTPIVVESHVGSLNAERTTSRQGSPVTAFLGDKVIRDSSRLDVLINPNISERNDWMNVDGETAIQVRMAREETIGTGSNLEGCAILGCGDYADSMYSLGRFVPKEDVASQRDVGNVPAKIQNALCTIDNPELIDIDYTVEGGLGTIWTTVRSNPDQWLTGDIDSQSYVFNDEVRLPVLKDLGRTDLQGNEPGELRNTWQTVFDLFETFVSTTRPCNGGVAAVHFSDPLRHIFIQGRDCKVWEGDKSAKSTFAELIYHPLKNLYKNVNTSYAVAYANWFKRAVVSGGKICWLPSSGKMTQVVADTPAPWSAAAGVNRGVVEGILDMAITPRLRDRDLLYKIQINSIYADRDYGNIAFAQQTLSKPATMAKELYVRRSLLWLQKEAIRVLKPYQFEANTEFTRSRIKTALEPAYQAALNGGGIQDYVIDFSTNTPADLQKGILRIEFLIKFNGVIKFIKLGYNVLNAETPFTEFVI